MSEHPTNADMMRFLIQNMATKEELGVMNAEIRSLREGMATKEDLGRMATKEDLGRMATKEDLGCMATKEDLGRMATKEDLGCMATKENLGRMVTKEDLECMATKEDLENVQHEIMVFLKEYMVTKDEFRAVLNAERHNLRWDILDLTDKKISDGKGDLVRRMRRGSKGAGQLIEVLHEKDILTQDERARLLALRSFPQERL